MSETFNNYGFNSTMSMGNYVVLIPKAGQSCSADSNAGSSFSISGTRPANTTVQLHSIYISKVYSGISENPEADSSLISLSVKRDSVKYYIMNNVMVLPNNSLFIEKTITLLPNDELLLEYNSSTSSVINTICSTVEIV